MKKVVTHSDRFHADDLFAVTVLDLVFDGDIEVIRSRDKDVIDSGDFVVDVGTIYDPEKGRFDHHQELTDSGVRENGIPYAAFGLIWKSFGEKLCSSKEVADYIDERLVMPIDAGDNGVSTFELTDYGISPYLIVDYLYSTQPTWKEDKSYDEAFMESKEMAKKILTREIERAEAFFEAKDDIIKYYDSLDDKEIVVFDEDFKYEDEDILAILAKHEEPKFIVKKTANDGNWKAKALRQGNDRKNTFKSRKDLPEAWGGLTGEELQKVSGIEDAVFCHRKLFMCVAGSKESAVKMAQIALES
jgi:uncharacterized UPF0160 family protein